LYDEKEFKEYAFLIVDTTTSFTIMATPTATSRALAITEIIEHILIQLPPQNILLAQGISKSVNNLIAASPALQATLCFRTTASATGTTTCSAETEVACTINPIILFAFPFLLGPHSSIPEDKIEDWKSRFGVQNPSPADAKKLPSHQWQNKKAYDRRNFDRPVGVDEVPPVQVSHQKFWYSQWLFNPTAWRQEDASWRRMLVTKEPLRRLVLLEIHRHQRSGGSTSECILLLGEHGQVPETTDTLFEARPKLNVEITRKNTKYRGSDSEPEEIPRRGWLKINDQPVDLTRWDSLPMSFVHDYLSEKVCRSMEPPSLQVSFHSSYPPGPDPIASERNVPEGIVERDGIGNGATMLIQTRSHRGCLIQMGRPTYPQLTSRSAGKIETGPWVTVSKSGY
jgi:hypothetical protein